MIQIVLVPSIYRLGLLPAPFFSNFNACENRLNNPPPFFFSFEIPLFIDELSTLPSASPSLLVHEICTSVSSSTIGSHESRLEVTADVAEVREPMDRPDASEDREELEVLRMNAGRGGERAERARSPPSLSWSSR
jgi:hypothetical protein